MAKLLRNISDGPSVPGIPFTSSAVSTSLPDFYSIYLTGYCEVCLLCHPKSALSHHYSKGLYDMAAGQTQMNITQCSVADINASPALPTVSITGLGSLNDIFSQAQNGISDLHNIKRVFFGILVLVVIIIGVSLIRVMPLHRLLSTKQIKDLRQLIKVLTVVGGGHNMALMVTDSRY